MNRLRAQPNRHNQGSPSSGLRVRPIALLLPLTLLASLATAAESGPGSRWRQGWGLAGHTAAPAATQGDGFASLRLQPRAGGHAAIAHNLLAGPVQVRLRGQDTPPAPLLLGAGEQRSLTWLADDGSGARLLLDAVPGDPAAHPDDHLYQLPLATGSVRVSQGFGGHFSHTDAQNRYAVDFPLVEGTPVLAARAGKVMQLLADSPGQGCLIRVLHADGSMALYAHLQPGSPRVRPGQPVETGQVLAASGNSGRSSGPHLHFAVQANTGMNLTSLPFRMASERGLLQFPREAGGAP